VTRADARVGRKGSRRHITQFDVAATDEPASAVTVGLMAMIVLARLLTQLRRFIAGSVSVSVPADRSQESREFAQGGSKVGR
jgi:hypothetical protein